MLLPRAMEVLDGFPENRIECVNIPVLGHVAAGVPLLAVENRDETFSLPVHFTRPRRVLYACCAWRQYD